MNPANSKVAILAIASFVVLTMFSAAVFPTIYSSSPNTARSNGVISIICDASQTASNDNIVDGLSLPSDDSSIAPVADVQSARSPLDNTRDSTSQISYKLIPDRTDTLHRPLELMENDNAHDPSFQELKKFLNGDNTASNKYVSPDFTCADFAIEIQHHAESQGIRCGYAGIDFLGKNEGHALAVFPTTDSGLIYVDDTSGSTILTRNLGTGMDYFNDGTIERVKNYW